MAGVADAVALDFEDLSPEAMIRLSVRLFVAGLAGGLIGWERGHAGKAAGLRTHILVALGAAGYVAVLQLAGAGADAISRAVQGIATGVGFLGAGCILKASGVGQVRGLTTAAGIWLTATIGAMAGSGRCVSAVLLCLFGWFTLTVLASVERSITPGGDQHESPVQSSPPFVSTSETSSSSTEHSTNRPS